MYADKYCAVSERALASSDASGISLYMSSTDCICKCVSH